MLGQLLPGWRSWGPFRVALGHVAFLTRDWRVDGVVWSVGVARVAGARVQLWEGSGFHEVGWLSKPPENDHVGGACHFGRGLAPSYSAASQTVSSGAIMA